MLNLSKLSYLAFNFKLIPKIHAPPGRIAEAIGIAVVFGHLHRKMGDRLNMYDKIK